MTATGCSNDSWNTGEFFERADAADILRCLREGADANARDEQGWTPLLRAAAFSKTPEVLTALPRNGADPNARDADGVTPLHAPARFSKAVPAVAQALLDAGADPAARDENDKRPGITSGWTLRSGSGKRTCSGSSRTNGAHRKEQGKTQSPRQAAPSPNTWPSRSRGRPRPICPAKCGIGRSPVTFFVFSPITR